MSKRILRRKGTESDGGATKSTIRLRRSQKWRHVSLLVLVWFLQICTESVFSPQKNMQCQATLPQTLPARIAFFTIPLLLILWNSEEQIEAGIEMACQQQPPHLLKMTLQWRYWPASQKRDYQRYLKQTEHWQHWFGEKDSCRATNSFTNAITDTQQNCKIKF